MSGQEYQSIVLVSSQQQGWHPPPALPTPLTGLLDSGGGGGGHGLGDIAKTVGSGSGRWARGQRSCGRPSELPHPLLSLVLSPLPIHILRVPGCSLRRETPTPHTAIRQERQQQPRTENTSQGHASSRQGSGAPSPKLPPPSSTAPREDLILFRKETNGTTAVIAIHVCVPAPNIVLS